MKTAILIIIVSLTGNGRAVDIEKVPMISMEICEIASQEISDAQRRTGVELITICVNDK